MFSHRDFKTFIGRIIPGVYMCVPEGPIAGVLWVGKRKMENEDFYQSCCCVTILVVTIVFFFF